MSVDRGALDAYRQHFHLFATKAFNIVNQGQELIPATAFLAMSHKLAEVEQGHIRRLIINVPPRSGKSLLASVALPAFLLGRDPTRRVICASYSGELAAKLDRDCRTVMQHPSYQQLFPATIIAGKNTETELETSHGGFRYATSVGGTLTGRGGNLIVIDDPMKPDEATTSARERVWDWFTGTVGSRLDNKAEDAIIVVMQRLHVDDLSGRLLERGGWDHLSIPAIADHEQELTIANGRTLVRPVGDILDPEREPIEILDELKSTLGGNVFAAQYQQAPVPEGGAMIKRQWLKRYHTLPARIGSHMIVQSWDTAQKPGKDNDFSVGTTWLVMRPDVYLMDVVRGRFDYPTLKREVVRQRVLHKPHAILIEDAGAGTALAQDLQRERVPVIAMRAEMDKVTRMSVRSVAIETGQLYLPTAAPWLADFETELLSFPNGRFDDQVDTVSQLFTWLYYRPVYTKLQGRYSST